MRRFATFFLLSLCSLGCGDDDNKSKDAAKDAPTDRALEASADGDAGRKCTSIFSMPAGAPSPTPTDAPAGAFDAVPNPASVDQDDTIFPFSVSAGDMNATSANLWTRAQGFGDDDLLVRVWPEADSEKSDVAVEFSTTVTVDEGGFAHVTAEPLRPGTRYLYAFGTFESDAPKRSAVGRFRTALSEDTTARFTAAATTCTGAYNAAVNEAVKPYPALSEMAKTDVDLLLHLGDITYNDGAKTPAQFNTEWEETRSQQGYLDLLPSTGMYAIWDDHEVDDEWSTEAPDESVRTAGKTAFQNWLPTQRGSDEKLWTQFRWGQSVEFFLLDTRSERVPSSREGQNPTFVSEEQLAWLEQGLKNSTAHFKVVMTSVVMANLQGAQYWDTPLARNDRWEGYGAQRDRLLDFIVDEQIDNVWFLSGDIHSGYVGRLEPEGHPYARMWEIVVGPGASNVNPITIGIENDLVDEEEVYPCNQFVFRHGHQHVETYLTFDPGSDTIRVVYEDGLSGEIMYDAALRQEPR